MTVPCHPPKVSVCVITYNQENFIGECLQSIVDQETDFDFEVIVGDDGSTDSTAKLVRDFEMRYPGLIRAIYQSENIGGGARNFRTVHLAATGEYVAHVDGDDVILPGKLQSQVDALDRNTKLSFAAHAVKVIGDERVIGADSRYPEYGDIKDLLQLGTYFAHSSVMYRRSTGSVKFFPEMCIDYYMHIGRAMHGQIYLDKRVFGLYRIHASSISQTAANWRKIEQYFEDAFDFALDAGIEADLVESARLDRRMKFAIARCRAGDFLGYKEVVALKGGDWRIASNKHRFLSVTRMFPMLVKIYLDARG